MSSPKAANPVGSHFPRTRSVFQCPVHQHGEEQRNTLGLLNLLKRGGPKLLKQLPKLWPMLLDPKARRMLMDAASDLASQSPTRRLRGRIEGTCAVAEGLHAEADNSDDKEASEGWVRRARNLMRQLDVPVQGRTARREKRAAIADQLRQLQDEMQSRLGQANQDGSD